MLPYMFVSFLVTVSAISLPEEFHTSDTDAGSGTPQGRIAGGRHEEEENEILHQVQVMVRSTNFCSGTVVNEHYILTAAHCLENANIDDVNVRAYSRIRNSGSVINLEEMRMHPNYDEPNSNLDIAYIRTLEPLSFNRNFQPIRLLNRNANIPNEIVVRGWGNTEKNEGLTNELRSVNLPVLNHLRCQAVYPEVLITRNMFCAENSRHGDRGACKGDAGAPAIDAKSGRLVGLSSFTRGCGPGMAPSVFTNVNTNEVRNFIEENMLL